MLGIKKYTTEDLDLVAQAYIEVGFDETIVRRALAPLRVRKAETELEKAIAAKTLELEASLSLAYDIISDNPYDEGRAVYSANEEGERDYRAIFNVFKNGKFVHVKVEEQRHGGTLYKLTFNRPILSTLLNRRLEIGIQSPHMRGGYAARYEIHSPSEFIENIVSKYHINQRQTFETIFQSFSNLPQTARQAIENREKTEAERLKNVAQEFQERTNFLNYL